jgi:hypothetical protein
MRTRFIVALATVVVFASCQKDYSEEYGQPTQANTTTNTTGAIGLNNCKASPYFPVCTGSEYHYTDTRGGLSIGTATGAPNDYTLTYLSDSTIEGKTYQKIKGAGGQITFFNSTNGVLTEIRLNENAQTNVAVPYLKFTVVKSNDAVGARWADSFNLPNSPSETNNYTIISKGLTRTVSGITYNDVMQIRQEVVSATYGATPYMHIDQFMAKGVGLIESISYNDIGGGSIMSATYYLNKLHFLFYKCLK